MEPFTKRASYRLTKCLRCGCEAHYKFDYVLDRNAAGEPVCRACFWRKWAVKQRMLASIPSVPVDLDKVRAHAERSGLDYLGPLTNPPLAEDPHRTQCRRCGKISAERVGDIGWGCTCRANPKRQTEAAPVGNASGTESLARLGPRCVGMVGPRPQPRRTGDTAKLRSPKRAVWRCPKCDTRFTEVIREMTELVGVPSVVPHVQCSRAGVPISPTPRAQREDRRGRPGTSRPLDRRNSASDGSAAG